MFVIGSYYLKLGLHLTESFLLIEISRFEGLRTHSDAAPEAVSQTPETRTAPL